MHYSLLPSSPSLHIPDGFLSIVVSLVFWSLSLLALGAALRRTRKNLGERELPLLGVLAAAIFAGQMLNFSIPGGTSGHLMGAALAVILLGPWPAVVVMSAVVVVQGLLFQDGGLLAMGANIFNMAVVGVAVSNVVYTLMRNLLKRYRRGTAAAGFAAAWASIVAAALATALQLALSGSSPANVAVPAMAAIHAVIGLGEGLITAGALAFLQAARKDILAEPAARAGDQKGLLWGGGALAVLLAVLSPLASGSPDGLEAFAERSGFGELAREASFKILPDYTLPGISDPVWTTILAALIGVGVVFALFAGLAKAARRRGIEAVEYEDE